MAKSGMLARSKDLQSFLVTSAHITIGIDLGDRFSQCCVLGADGRILTEGRVMSTPEGRLDISNNSRRPALHSRLGPIRDG